MHMSIQWHMHTQHTGSCKDEAETGFYYKNNIFLYCMN